VPNTVVLQMSFRSRYRERRMESRPHGKRYCVRSLSSLLHVIANGSGSAAQRTYRGRQTTRSRRFDLRSGWAISVVQNQRLGDGGPNFPQMEPTDQLDASNRRLPESRVRQFAKRKSASRTSSILLVNLSHVSLRRSGELAGIGSGDAALARLRDTRGDSARST
jgi:hypothetical protein